MRLEVWLTTLLKSRGWVKLREGSKHVIWQYTNGQQIGIPHRLADMPRLKKNFLRDIKKAEAL